MIPKKGSKHHRGPENPNTDPLHQQQYSLHKNNIVPFNEVIKNNRLNSLKYITIPLIQPYHHQCGRT